MRYNKIYEHTFARYILIVKHLLLYTLVFFTSGFAFGQMQMGASHDNINVTAGIRLNPALAVDPIPWIDIEAVGLYVFGSSNAAYLAKDEFSALRMKFPGSMTQNFSKKKVNGQIESVILGPAINISLGKFSVGASTSFRNYISGRGIEKKFAQGLIYGLQLPEYYKQTLNGSNYRTKALSFLEFAVNGGIIAYQKEDFIVNIGAKFKYLLGLGGVNILVDDFSYSMTDSTNANVINYTGKYGGSPIGFHPGTGYGVDFGITIEKKINSIRYYTPHSTKSNCKHVDYLYRLGFSVLDLGSIKFNGTYKEVIGANGTWNDYASIRSSNIENVLDQFDNILQNGITKSSSTYKAKLPLAFSLQFDYNFGRGLFINSTLVYGAPLKHSFGGERLSLLAITPRFESNNFGFSAPISINSIGKGGIGLAVRIWNLTIGTDNINSYLINTDVYQLDIYAHIKVPIFKSPPCRTPKFKKYNWRVRDCNAPGSRRK